MSLYRNPQLNSWLTPNNLLYRWIPLSFGLFLIGYLLSLSIMTSGQELRIEDAIMSDILSPINNPNGYLISVIATAISSIMLLPTANFFQKNWHHPFHRPATFGAWMYRTGLISVIVLGITTPFQMPYSPIHIYLAYTAFMGIIGGLAVCLVVIFLSFSLYRFPIAILLFLLIGVFIFLVYVFTVPDFFNGRRWFLALCEWLLIFLLATGIFSISAMRVNTSSC